MKKSFLFFLFVFAPILLFAETVEIDGIYYELITKARVANVTSGDKKYSGDIVIPSEVIYNDIKYNVVSIADRAFYNSLVSKVELPSSILTIGDEAFSSCISLVSLNIPNKVTSIGKSAFAGCRVTDITIPASVETIKFRAFCIGTLKSVRIDGYIVYGNPKVYHLVIEKCTTSQSLAKLHLIQ